MHILSPLTITTTNTHSIISTPQVEFEEDGVYAALPLPCKGIEVVPYRPSTQEKHIKK